MLKLTENRQKRLDAARLYEVKVLSVETAEKRRKRLQAGTDYSLMLRHVELGNIKIHCALRKHISNVLK